MRIASRRSLTAVTLGLVLTLLPIAANACEEGGGPAAPELTLVYLYQKLNPAAPASWANSGHQDLLLIRDGHRWVSRLDVSLLPDGVCGPGWAVQEDQTRGLARADVPTVVDRRTGTGVLGWPPVVAARHLDLERYLTVPDCEVDPPVEEVIPTPTPEPTQITSEPLVTPPAVAEQVEAAPAVPVQAAPSFAG